MTDEKSDKSSGKRKNTDDASAIKKRPQSKTGASDKQESERRRAKSASSSAKKDETAKPEPWVGEETITGLFDRLSDITNSAFSFAKKTTDTSYRVGKALIQSQDQLKVMLAAGQSLKDLREVAGLTISELNEALQLKDKSLLEAVENGTATLSFELILRLSALLARNDPIPFILKYSRTYSPETWKLLHDWGAGRLPLQYQREREFINIFRSKDQARQLSDEGYSKVLEFTREAFNLSLHFIAEQEAELEKFRAQNTGGQHTGRDSDTDKESPAEELAESLKKAPSPAESKDDHSASAHDKAGHDPKNS